MDSSRFASQRVLDIQPSGIRKFFDIVATMKDVISLGIGEPDFDTPEPIIAAGVSKLQAGETHYTSNSGLDRATRRAQHAHGQAVQRGLRP